MQKWLLKTTEEFEQAGIKTARLDALVLLEYVTETTRAHVLANGEQALTSEQENLLKKLVARRAKREPLAYITGLKEFYGLELVVTPDVLIPRPETESVVELALKLTPPNGRLVDVGTGSGAIAVACQHARPDLDVTASDASEPALAIARQNARRHSTDINFIQSDLLNDIPDTFDTVAANLPYIPDSFHIQEDEVAYEPGLALFGGDDGLDLYCRLFEQLPRRTKPGSHLMIEADLYQHRHLKAMLSRLQWRHIETEGFALAFHLTTN